MRWFLLALFFALAVKATEVFICYYDDNGIYRCELISEQSTVKEEIITEEVINFRMKK